MKVDVIKSYGDQTCSNFTIHGDYIRREDLENNKIVYTNDFVVKSGDKEISAHYANLRYLGNGHFLCIPFKDDKAPMQVGLLRMVINNDGTLIPFTDILVFEDVKSNIEHVLRYLSVTVPKPLYIPDAIKMILFEDTEESIYSCYKETDLAEASQNNHEHDGYY